MKIKKLTTKDWLCWKEIRLEALKSFPNTFASSFEEEVKLADQVFKEQLINSDVFVVLLDSLVIACAGFYTYNQAKTRHKGVIFGMFTKNEYTGQGVASALLKAIIDHARSKVLLLQLKCVTTNSVAIDLYIKHGFVIYGTEPCALKLDDNFVDEHLMMLDLR